MEKSIKRISFFTAKNTLFLIDKFYKAKKNHSNFVGGARFFFKCLNGRKYGIFVLFLFCIVSSQKIIKYIWVDVQICWGGRFTKQYGCHTQSDMASIQNNMATIQHNMATIQNVKSSLFCGTLSERRWSRKLLFQQ